MESTGKITAWTGNLLEIGPLYPFVGSEVFLAVLLLVFWVGWHLWQLSMESRWLREEERLLRQGQNLEAATAFEHTPERM